MDTYYMHEGTIDIPDAWNDRSANIFAVGNKLPLDLSFVVTREDLGPGRDLSEYAEQKLAEHEAQLKQFRLVEKRQVEVANGVALETEFKWRSDMGLMHQRQTYVQHGGRVLIFTATARRELTADQHGEISAVIASFQPRG